MTSSICESTELPDWIRPGTKLRVKATMATVYGLAVYGPDRRDNAAWANEIGVVTRDNVIDGKLRLEFSRGRSCDLVEDTLRYVARVR